MIKIEPYNERHLNDYLSIVPLLWNDVEVREIIRIIEQHKTEDGHILLAFDKDQLIGFLNSTIRTDYVEGSEADKTGYVEGIFVKETNRKQKIGKQLFEALVTYYKAKNITSIGSDAFVDNIKSDQFHKAIGFNEVSVNRHYVYKIERNNKE